MKAKLVILVLCMSLGFTNFLNGNDSFNKVDLQWQFGDSYEMQSKFNSAALKKIILAEANEDIEEAMEDVEEAMEDVEEALSEIPGSPGVNINISKTFGDTPLMGVFLADMDFQEAYEMHYDYCYGVLIKGVVDGGGAQKAGLMSGDIIMEFDRVKARFEDHLVKLIKSKKVGDAVDVKFFRDEDIMTTTVVLGSRKKAPSKEEEVITKEGKIIKKKKLSPGNGGGSWIPVWYVTNDKFEDVNDIITSYGFTELREEGLFLNGGGGKGMIGKGWFIGGMGVGYSIDRKIIDTTGVKRMMFSTGYGGVTLDKRIPLTEKLISAVGFMLGWGGYKLEFSNIGETYDWNTLNTQLTDSKNNYIKMKKNYILFQPKISCLYRINDWLGIRAEAGYLLSYSYHSGWNASICKDTFEIKNSPDTSFDGYTITIGPWFGF